MKDISRRDAISKIATGAAGLGLVAASRELVTASQGVMADTTPTRAFRGQHLRVMAMRTEMQYDEYINRIRGSYAPSFPAEFYYWSLR